MSKSSERVKLWRKRTRERMLESMGSKCACCEYDRCLDILEFHHIDPKEKSFSLGSARANIFSWKTIVKELKKCILVCQNCHGEIHAGFREIPDNVRKFNPEYENYKLKEKEKSYCPVCNGEKPIWQKTCSRVCGGKLNRKVDWEKVDLEKLIKKEEKSLKSIGKQLGVTDNAVRKRAKKLGII
jgi:hypothetical protein